jgi:exodeoxyribonuclease V alpha subunit
MSSSIDTNEAPFVTVMPAGWTSSGTTRSSFAEGLTDVSLKNKIAAPALTESLMRMRRQFAEIQLGSEYFFQALDFLNWAEPDISRESPEENQRFHVLLSGLLLMRKANISGSTCLPRKILQTQILASLLNSGFSVNELSLEKWQKWLLTSYGTEKDSTPAHTQNAIFTANHSLLYFSKYWQAESRLLSLIRKRIKMNPHVPESSIVENVLETVLVKQPVLFGKETLSLADEQKAAVLLSISSPLLIITGGPGTGKTSVAVTLLRVLKRLGLAERPALAAPTGRAAKRMSEAVVNSLNSLENLKQLPLEQQLLEDALEAKTLHRLLAYRPGTHSFKHHEYDPLEHDLLIIDEGSMIDQEMMSSLLGAANSELPHQRSVPRIILLGDAQQLPSVGNGAVLLELTKNSSIPETAGIAENPLHIVRLLRSYRQEIGDAAGRNILGVAETVKEMEHDPRPELLFNAKAPNHEIIRRLKSLEEVEKEKVFLLNQTNSPAQLEIFARWWVVNYLSDEKFLYEIQQSYLHDASESRSAKLDYLFEHLKHFRVLTATQVLPSGAMAVNQKISECWLAENGIKDSFSEYYPGKPVMVTENNYKLQLFNGDQGIFLKFINPESREVELKVVFAVEGEFKTFYQYELHHLQTAYAITVHKSQGSEYNHLALILPALSRERWASENESRSIGELMSREMLYTALTRAKKSVLILGEQSVLEEVALHKVSRYSGIGAALVSK